MGLCEIVHSGDHDTRAVLVGQGVQDVVKGDFTLLCWWRIAHYGGWIRNVAVRVFLGYVHGGVLAGAREDDDGQEVGQALNAREGLWDALGSAIWPRRIAVLSEIFDPALDFIVLGRQGERCLIKLSCPKVLQIVRLAFPWYYVATFGYASKRYFHFHRHEICTWSSAITPFAVH